MYIPTGKKQTKNFFYPGSYPIKHFKINFWSDIIKKKKKTYLILQCITGSCIILFKLKLLYNFSFTADSFHQYIVNSDPVLDIFYPFVTIVFCDFFFQHANDDDSEGNIVENKD